ncbi:putative uncharacterized protein DDB_G0282133 isoform X2 [Hydractinia symbiolongicarpus]|nr:putative uncharacterized protein DDB_G0282133 isoform X2 [Hydractinia symbiolongicarpus]XP_057297219.1 putative uncharacterized protein DDB_G0282133 isoform X2 [Hydractinia symbiolongicarpus]
MAAIPQPRCRHEFEPNQHGFQQRGTVSQRLEFDVVSPPIMDQPSHDVYEKWNPYRFHSNTNAAMQQQLPGKQESCFRDSDACFDLREQLNKNRMKENLSPRESFFAENSSVHRHVQYDFHEKGRGRLSKRCETVQDNKFVKRFGFEHDRERYYSRRKYKPFVERHDLRKHEKVSRKYADYHGENVYKYPWSYLNKRQRGRSPKNAKKSTSPVSDASPSNERSHSRSCDTVNAQDPTDTGSTSTEVKNSQISITSQSHFKQGRRKMNNPSTHKQSFCPNFTSMETSNEIPDNQKNGVQQENKQNDGKQTVRKNLSIDNSVDAVANQVKLQIMSDNLSQSVNNAKQKVRDKTADSSHVDDGGECVSNYVENETANAVTYLSKYTYTHNRTTMDVLQESKIRGKIINLQRSSLSPRTDGCSNHAEETRNGDDNAWKLRAPGRFSSRHPRKKHRKHKRSRSRERSRERSFEKKRKKHSDSQHLSRNNKSHKSYARWTPQRKVTESDRKRSYDFNTKYSHSFSVPGVGEFPADSPRSVTSASHGSNEQEESFVVLSELNSISHVNEPGSKNGSAESLETETGFLIKRTNERSTETGKCHNTSTCTTNQPDLHIKPNQESLYELLNETATSNLRKTKFVNVVEGKKKKQKTEVCNKNVNTNCERITVSKSEKIVCVSVEKNVCNEQSDSCDDERIGLDGQREVSSCWQENIGFDSSQNKIYHNKNNFSNNDRLIDASSCSTNGSINLNIEANLQRNIKLNLEHNTKLNLDQNIKLNIEPNTKPHFKPNTKLNSPQNIKLNLQQNIKPNLEPNTKPNSRQNIKPNLEENVKSNLEPNTKPNSQQNINLNLQHNIKPNLEQNVKPKLEQNIMPNLEPNTKPNSQQDTKPNSQQDTKPNSQQNVKPNLQHNTKSNLGRNIKLNIEPNIKPNLDQYIKPSLEQNVKPNLQHNIEPNFQQNIKSNLQYLIRTVQSTSSQNKDKSVTSNTEPSCKNTQIDAITGKQGSFTRNNSSSEPKRERSSVQEKENVRSIAKTQTNTTERSSRKNFESIDKTDLRQAENFANNTSESYTTQKAIEKTKSIKANSLRDKWKEFRSETKQLDKWKEFRSETKQLDKWKEFRNETKQLQRKSKCFEKTTEELTDETKSIGDEMVDFLDDTNILNCMDKSSGNESAESNDKKNSVCDKLEELRDITEALKAHTKDSGKLKTINKTTKDIRDEAKNIDHRTKAHAEKGKHLRDQTKNSGSKTKERTNFYDQPKDADIKKENFDETKNIGMYQEAFRNGTENARDETGFSDHERKIIKSRDKRIWKNKKNRQPKTKTKRAHVETNDLGDKRKKINDETKNIDKKQGLRDETECLHDDITSSLAKNYLCDKTKSSKVKIKKQKKLQKKAKDLSGETVNQVDNLDNITKKTKKKKKKKDRQEEQKYLNKKPKGSGKKMKKLNDATTSFDEKQKDENEKVDYACVAESSSDTTKGDSKTTNIKDKDIHIPISNLSEKTKNSHKAPKATAEKEIHEKVHHAAIEVETKGWSYAGESHVNKQTQTTNETTEGVQENHVNKQTQTTNETSEKNVSLNKVKSSDEDSCGDKSLILEMFRNDVSNIATAVKLLIRKRPRLNEELTEACKEILTELGVAVKKKVTKYDIT